MVNESGRFYIDTHKFNQHDQLCPVSPAWRDSFFWNLKTNWFFSRKKFLEDLISSHDNSDAVCETLISTSVPTLVSYKPKALIPSLFEGSTVLKTWRFKLRLTKVPVTTINGTLSILVNYKGLSPDSACYNDVMALLTSCLVWSCTSSKIMREGVRNLDDQVESDLSIIEKVLDKIMLIYEKHPRFLVESVPFIISCFKSK